MRLILRNAKTTTEGKTYTAQFWTPGLVSYCDSGAGVALLRKETMDAMLPSFVGKPVTIEHVEGSPEEIENAGKAVGKVTKAYWNPDTGWYNCDFTVENDEAKTKVESGWSVSCAFDVSEQTGPGGEYNAIPYQEEITSGTFTHLALVENPRYEDSKIFRNHKMRLNAKGVKMNKKYAVGDRVEYRGTIGTVTGYSGEIVVIDYDKGGSAHVAENNPDLKMRGDLTPFEGSKENAKTVLISIPYRLLERDDDKNPDQELQARGLRNVGGGGGVADFEFNGTESQAAAIVKQVLGTVSGVDIGMMNSKAAQMIVPKQNDSASDFGTILREIKEQLYQMAQALGSKFSGKENAAPGENDSIKWEVDESGERYFTDPVLKRKVYEKNLRNPEKVAMERLKQTHPDLYEKRLNANAGEPYSVEPIKKNSRVILKPGKSNSTQEKKPMFGLFKRKSKKNDQEAAPEKLPLEQIDVEIDGVAVPLSELVTGYKAEQAEIAEKAKLEQAQAAKEVTEAPAPEANADNTAPEDLNLESQEFSVEDGSRYNMTELVDSYNRRKAAKCNAEADAKAKAEKEAAEKAAADEAAKKNASETPEQKAEREAKENSEKDAKEKADKEAKENAAAEEAKKKADEEAAAKAKENAKKDPKYFHKLNDLKNAGEVITGKAIETLSDKIERGNARYGSKKK